MIKNKKSDILNQEFLKIIVSQVKETVPLLISLVLNVRLMTLLTSHTSHIALIKLLAILIIIYKPTH